MRTTILLAIALILGAVCCGAAFAQAGVDSQGPPDTEGFLYGTVSTRSGNEYVGRLRWGTEESFWGDHFNSTKEDLPWWDEVPKGHRGRENTFKLFGLELTWRDEDSEAGRQLIARFGDIDRIEVTGRDDAVLVMKSGKQVEIEGGSNDLGGGTEIAVWDDSLGKVEIDWPDVERIRFHATPADLDVDVHRLYGVVRTTEGAFRGWIQWDKDECLSMDELDGETRDGDDVEIPMGNIRSIERRGWSSSRVTLRDGREMVLDDSNDVDDDNRGIFVETGRLGRVLVSWDAFERADFEDPPGSGPAYGDFVPGGPLRGTVTTRDGAEHTGRLVYDVDEEETWELLGGERDGIEYDVPFSLVASVTPTGRDRSRVELTNGEVLELEDSADVGEGNAGVVILADGERPLYVPWDDVERIDFGR